MPFNASEHLMQIKSSQGSKDYLEVKWRLVWFRDKFPNGSIETEMLHFDLDRETEEEVYVYNQEKRKSEKVIKRANGFVIFKATVKDGQGGIATGTKTEKAASFPDFIEKAESGAIGRALAALGFGTQFTGNEFDEAHRIVDSPVDRNASPPESNGNRMLAQPLENIPTVSQLKEQCSALFGADKWEIVKDKLNLKMSDEEMAPEHCAIVARQFARKAS